MFELAGFKVHGKENIQFFIGPAASLRETDIISNKTKRYNTAGQETALAVPVTICGIEDVRAGVVVDNGGNIVGVSR